jgi:hypothetical protein
MGTGTVANADVAAQVTCVSSYTVGGTVSGLVGNSLVLQVNDVTNQVTVNASGTFTFPHPLPNGTAYVVTRASGPALFSQTCTVTAGSGTLSGANVTNVQVTCGTPTAFSTTMTGGTIPDGSGTCAMPASGAPLDRSIVIPVGQSPFLVTKVSVTITGLTHPTAGDLLGWLLHNDGTTTVTVPLFARVGRPALGSCGSSSAFSGDYTFADTALGTLDAVAAGSPVPPGSYRPATTNGVQGSLAAPPNVGFWGATLPGTWTLRLADAVTLGVGSYTSWTLTLKP